MFERFTASARSAVRAAAAEAEGLGSGQIRAEHLVVGLVAIGDPVLLAAGFTAPDARAALQKLSRDAWQEHRDNETLLGMGIDVEALRRDVEQNFGTGAWASARPEAAGWRGRPRRGSMRFSPAARKALELSLREAIRRKDRSIRPEHIILGITRDPGDLARPLLESRATIDGLRTRAESSLDEAA